MTEQQFKLYRLLKTGKYGVIEIINILHIGDPRSTIRKIRKQGINVRDEWRETVSGSRFKLYWIDG